MSATSVNRDHGNEAEYLRLLKFSIKDSHIAGDIDPEAQLEVRTLQAFLDRSRSCARIIFCTKDDVKVYQTIAKMKGYNVEINHEIMADLRALTEDDCLLVSEPHLMRGVDYRA